MGYYIQGPLHGKASMLISDHGAQPCSQNPPKVFTDIPEDQALVVVINNGLHEAACLAYSEFEFKDLMNPADHRPKMMLLMDKEIAYRLAGYKE